MSKSGKVENCALAMERDNSFGKKNYHFLVKFEGDDQKYIHVSVKNTPVFKIGETLEYEEEIKDDGTPFKAQASDKIWLPKIKPPKKDFNGGGFGGGKSNWQPKSKEQYNNDIVGYVGGYAKDLLIARQDIAKGNVDQILIEYDKLVKGMTKSLQELTK